jgi:hypothetical protein
VVYNYNQVPISCLIFPQNFILPFWYMCFNFRSVFLKSWLTTDVEAAVDVYNINLTSIEPGNNPVVSQQSSHVGCGVT